MGLVHAPVQLNPTNEMGWAYYFIAYFKEGLFSSAHQSPWGLGGLEWVSLYGPFTFLYFKFNIFF